MDHNARKLPDIEICQIKEIGIAGFDQCMVEYPVECFYVLPFGNNYFCRHPKRRENFHLVNMISASAHLSTK